MLDTSRLAKATERCTERYITRIALTRTMWKERDQQKASSASDFVETLFLLQLLSYDIYRAILQRRRIRFLNFFRLPVEIKRESFSASCKQWVY